MTAQNFNLGGSKRIVQIKRIYGRGLGASAELFRTLYPHCETPHTLAYVFQGTLRKSVSLALRVKPLIQAVPEPLSQSAQLTERFRVAVGSGRAVAESGSAQIVSVILASLVTSNNQI